MYIPGVEGVVNIGNRIHRRKYKDKRFTLLFGYDDIYLK